MIEGECRNSFGDILLHVAFSTQPPPLLLLSWTMNANAAVRALQSQSILASPSLP